MTHPSSLGWVFLFLMVPAMLNFLEQEVLRPRLYYAIQHQIRYASLEDKAILRAVIANEAEPRFVKLIDDVRKLAESPEYLKEVEWMDGLDENTDPTPAHPFLCWLIVRWPLIFDLVLTPAT